MSANVETMAYTGEPPWHGMGVHVADDMTPDEMLRAADLDWSVEKRRLFYRTENEDGETAYAPSDKMSLVRASDDTELSIVGNGWEPIQNEEAFSIFNDFVREGGMTMESAGSLYDGKIVWGLAKTTEAFRVFGDDEIRGYFLFSNPHQYGKTATFGGTSVRVVCSNTHSWALENGLDNRIVMSHRTKFDPEIVQEALKSLHMRLEEFKSQVELLDARYSEENVKTYFDGIFPVTGTKGRKEVSLNARRAYEVLETQPGAEYAPGTWWNAYNAVSYIIDHVAGNDDHNRLHSSWWGRGRAKKIEALEAASDFAIAA